MNGDQVSTVSTEQLNAAIRTDPEAKISPSWGSVATLIGVGENAQNAIVYKTISWCFVSAGLLSVAAVCYAFYKGVEKPMESVKDVWAIFSPIITLALGYIFGRGKGAA